MIEPMRICGTCGDLFTVGPADDLCHECGHALRVEEMIKFGMRADRVSLRPRPLPFRRRGRTRIRRFLRWITAAKFVMRMREIVRTEVEKMP